MFSRTTALMIGVVLFITATFTVLTLSSRDVLRGNGAERVVVSLIAPFQMLVSSTSTWYVNTWTAYFSTASAVLENRELKKKLGLAMAAQNRCRELELENARLRRLMDFGRSSKELLIAAWVTGGDPSPWSKSVMINKGRRNGLSKGLPVLVSEGVVGQIISVFDSYARVLLVTDRNSAVDALVQNSRARGIVQGNNSDECLFTYVLRKDEVVPGDLIVSSGLDQVFPKGIEIGEVVAVKKGNSELFQSIYLKTFVDFDKLEEVLVSVQVTSAVPKVPSAASMGIAETEEKEAKEQKIAKGGDKNAAEE